MTQWGGEEFEHFGVGFKKRCCLKEDVIERKREKESSCYSLYDCDNEKNKKKTQEIIQIDIKEQIYQVTTVLA